jgi:hypothetical protein
MGEQEGMKGTAEGSWIGERKHEILEKKRSEQRKKVGGNSFSPFPAL